MVNPLAVFWAAIKDLFEEFLLLIICNLIWAFMSLPLLGLALTMIEPLGLVPAIITSLIGGVPAGVASVGLAFVAHRVSDGRAIKLGHFFEGMRTYWRPGALLGVLWLFGLAVILVDLGFYGSMGNLLGSLMVGLWFYALLIWLGALIYAFPLLLLQDKPNLRIMARNALLMTLGRPLFTLATLILMSFIAGLSSVLVAPIFLLTFSLFTLWGMRATQALIAADLARREALDQTAEAPAEKGRKGQVRPK
jgi:uncharacterized membrane protein YesL